MAHVNKVARSIETPDGSRCVDLWTAPDGRHGFAEYRRDPEDPRGWSPTGYEAGGFASAQEARDAACRAVPWFADIFG